MDHSEDVGRLFSWLKAPMVHYREFTPRSEIADAVATWPVLHDAAVRTGRANGEPAPHGDAAVRERLARERRAFRTIEPTAEPTAGVAAMDATDRPRESAPRVKNGVGAAGTAADRAVEPGPAAPNRPLAGPAARPFDARAETTARRTASSESFPRKAHEPLARPESPTRPEAAAPTRPDPSAAGDRAGLFSGEYRRRDPHSRPNAPVTERHDRSLDAVFSRLSGGRDRLPDPRTRARTSPGLNSVFTRLR